MKKKTTVIVLATMVLIAGIFVIVIAGREAPNSDNPSTQPVCEGDDADSLAARLFEQECIAYPEAISLFAEGRLRIDGDIVRVG